MICHPKAWIKRIKYKAEKNTEIIQQYWNISGNNWFLLEKYFFLRSQINGLCDHKSYYLS